MSRYFTCQACISFSEEARRGKKKEKATDKPDSFTEKLVVHLMKNLLVRERGPSPILIPTFVPVPVPFPSQLSLSLSPFLVLLSPALSSSQSLSSLVDYLNSILIQRVRSVTEGIGYRDNTRIASIVQLLCTHTCNIHTLNFTHIL